MRLTSAYRRLIWVRQVSQDSEARFAEYVEGLTSVIGHADRAAPLRDYCTGLLAAEGRKSVEPMAAVTAPAGVSAQHQKLLHFVANAPWSDEPVLAKVREMVVPAIERHGPIEAWIIDDTSFPKQGTHSVGVHHQYCGQLGKQANCQVVVTLSIANHHASLPIAYRLYLPQEWAEDAARRKKARVPEEITFKTKPQIALEQIRAACAAGVPRGVVLMDAGYGATASCAAASARWGSAMWPPSWTSKCLRWPRDASKPSAAHERQAVGAEPAETCLAHDHVAGRHERAAGLALCPRAGAHLTHQARRGRAEETLLIEWPEGEAEPTNTGSPPSPESTSFRRLVDIAKMRWRIERDYQDLKQEIGLGHYEGRGWPGFHHHGTLCIAAYGFLISERETIPPSAPRSSRSFTKPAIPDGYRPRGAPDPAPTPHPQLDRDHASHIGRRDRPNAAAMPMLRA